MRHIKTSATDRVFAALSNPLRRTILDMLLDGPLALQDIAGKFDMARQSVSEHVKVLLEVGLITEQRQGRYRYYAVHAEPLQELATWLTPYERFWRGRLGAMREVLDAEQAKQERSGAQRGDKNEKE